MSLFTPNTDTIEGFYEKGKFILAWRLSMLFCFVFIILSITFVTAPVKVLAIFILCALISMLSLLYLKRSKKSQFIYLALSILGTLIAAYTLNFFMDIIHYGDFLWLILIIVFSFFGLGVRYGFVFLAANVANIIYYALNTVNTNVAELVPLTQLDRLSLAIEMVAATLSITYVVYQFIMFHTYTYNELKTANTELKLQNNIISNQNIEKTTLVQEVHHRVKNNLQIIVSLLRLQKKEIKSDEAKSHFSEAIKRVMVMSSIHQKLYKDKSFTQIVLKDYLTELTNDILSLSSSHKKVQVTIASEMKNIGLKTIVPLGLIVNELVSNSIQHGFQEDGTGVIDMTVVLKDDNCFEMNYKDNGTWVQPAESYSSFGLELISILVSQLDGNYKRESGEGGTNYFFSLQNLD